MIENGTGGNQIRINISKERKVVNHMNDQHENTNLLFYNFNSYLDKQSKD
jgi:hypothetical protein